MKSFVTGFVVCFVLAAWATSSAQHPAAKTCPDKCHCAETGRCGCVQCPTEMSAGLTKRAVVEGKRLVAFVAVKEREIPGCLTYGTPRGEQGRPARYIAVFAPDGTGGGIRYDLPPDATDEIIRVTGDPRPLPAPPGMPRSR